MNIIQKRSKRTSNVYFLISILFFCIACEKHPKTPIIISREGWHAIEPIHTIPLEKSKRNRETFDGICIHYSGFSDQISPASLQHYHIFRLQYPDVTYHFIIDRKGKIYEGRDALYFSETRQGKDTNIHICCISSLKFPPREWLPKKQKNSLQNLIYYLMNFYNINIENIFFYDSTGFEDLDFM
ncbi:MAG: N-acetylmuramoyl-L-alanine amidase [Candidatus Marinimicrobia bacterium]|nr:N-acetylmuramoyl-L-alanine amidase [Candidatus Neomarinimicrobiota bacterium]